VRSAASPSQLLSRLSWKNQAYSGLPAALLSSAFSLNSDVESNSCSILIELGEGGARHAQSKDPQSAHHAERRIHKEVRMHCRVSKPKVTLETELKNIGSHRDRREKIALTGTSPGCAKLSSPELAVVSFSCGDDYCSTENYI